MKHPNFRFSALSVGLLLSAGLMSQQAVAAPTYCSAEEPTTTNGVLYTSDVTFTTLNSAAVSISATDCYGPDVPSEQGGNVLVGTVNSLDWGNGFVDLDKTGEASTLFMGQLTFTLTAQTTTNDGTWSLSVADFNSTAPNLPTYMDLVFSLKGSNNAALYYFDEILIGGANGGDFEISFTNNGTNNPNLSNAALFGRLGTNVYVPPNEEPPTETPEPGMLFLMGAGLLGLGMARRRKSA